MCAHTQLIPRSSEISEFSQFKQGFLAEPSEPSEPSELSEATCREEGVYLLTIGWKSRGGHATILQRTKDGLFYVEPQAYNEKQGALRSISELCLRSGSNPISTRGILRIDNKLLNPKFLSIFEK